MQASASQSLDCFSFLSMWPDSSGDREVEGSDVGALGSSSATAWASASSSASVCFVPLEFAGEAVFLVSWWFSGSCSLFAEADSVSSSPESGLALSLATGGK